MYLIDTNIFLEALLQQKKAEEVLSFLTAVDSTNIFLSDLSLHSVGIILFRLKKFELFLEFIEDLRVSETNIISLEEKELQELVKSAIEFNLDFDDSYQYTIAKKYELILVSFDKDFDKTKIGRREPASIAP